MKHIFSLLFVFLFCDYVSAQVPVIKEPHHKPVLVNDYIRLLDVHLNAGDTTQYHVHAAPSVIVMISKSIIGIQKMGEAPAMPGEVLPAQTSFIDYGKNPVTHRVFNSGDNVFHVMDIELVKNSPSADSCLPLQESNAETTINERLVRGYKLNINQNQSINRGKSSCAHILICISGEVSASNKNLTSGEYIFFNPNTNISVNNNRSDAAICVLLELK